MKYVRPFILFLAMLVLAATAQAQFSYETNGSAIVLTDCAGLGGAVTISNFVTIIGSNAFASCTKLENITIPASVTTIEFGAFGGCESLTNVSIPDSVTSIGQDAFLGCIYLTNITIPGSVSSIGDNAFYGCLFLANVTMSNGVTSLGYSVFYECTHLTNITMPASMFSIGESAFYDCAKLKNIIIPDGVPSIGALTFFACTSLTTLTISASVTNIADIAYDPDVFSGDLSLVSINVDPLNPAYSSVDGVLFDKSQTTLLQYPAGRLAKSYVVPNGVTSIADSAFSVGNDFFFASDLAYLTIAASVTNIGDGAFEGCVGLKALYFLGNYPSGDWMVVLNGITPSAAVYHLPGTTGFGRGYPWVLPYPVILQSATNFGVQPSGFSFTVSWASNATVVVQACANLSQPDWQPLQTNTIAASNGVWLFSDPQWANYPARYYRLGFP
jgi:hypothetical protein